MQDRSDLAGRMVSLVVSDVLAAVALRFGYLPGQLCGRGRQYGKLHFRADEHPAKDIR